MDTLDQETIHLLVRWADLLGVFANGLLGGVIARSHRFDPVGFFVLAIASGLGGGMIRDTLLQHGPPVALTDYAYLSTVLVAAVIAFFIPLDGRTWNLVFPLVDALAVGAWASAGSQKTLALGLGVLPAILLGTITAVGGGLLRDVMLRRIPSIFGGNTLYATSAALASAVMVLMWQSGQFAWATIATIVVGSGLTLLATWRGWVLPESYELRIGLALGRIPRPAWRSRTRGRSPRAQ